ncbi:hypothetical protein XM53_12570 [Roseovarius atlanticus]|uniref:Pentapeptide repeat-containing protein n=1 Tax=Roseovarius atlanticus TaxID=1641875 RepID=A0A0T5NTF4_9RHOB|nr:hypothetical protein XM53_12570 [Roseovarius atlanticus]
MDFKNMNEADVQGFDYVGDGQAFVGQNIGKVNLSDIRVGSKDLKDLLLSDAELRSRFETVAEDMRKAETEREALEVLKQSQFGKWLAKQKFVDWARLVFSIWTDGS